MKIPCKLRREGWKATDRGDDLPKGVSASDLVDVIFWNDIMSYDRLAGAWCWGWQGVVHGSGMSIRYWRFTPK